MKLIEVYDLQDLKQRGFDTNTVLYHGSDHKFDAFDKTFAVSAKHIYTTPDPSTASGYGKYVYEVVAKLHRPADLIEDYDVISKVASEFKPRFRDDFKFTPVDELFSDAKKKGLDIESHEEKYDIFVDEYLKKDEEADVSEAQDEYEGTDEYDQFIDFLAYNATVEFLQSGKIYDYDFKGHLQDDILDYCFSLGYNHVIMYDYSSYGDPVSYVFDDPKDLVILGEYER